MAKSVNKKKEKPNTPVTNNPVVTQEELCSNQSLQEEEVEVGDELETPSPKITTTEKESKLNEKMKSYISSYPKNKKFLIASDGQVFLEKNERDAQEHQKFISPKKSLEVFIVK
ncbi:MAG: hypothetical protein LC122_05125 [Chitinophagales bacterium]|nr:hypothetical protein [Chitinophagales bacterium]